MLQTSHCVCGNCSSVQPITGNCCAACGHRKDGASEHDQNGNPRDFVKNMRQTGQSMINNSPFARAFQPYHKDVNFKHYMPGGNDHSEETMPPTSDFHSGKKSRRPKLKERANLLPAGNIPGNIGDRSVDELLSFIECSSESSVSNSATSQKQSHLSGASSSTTTTPKQDKPNSDMSAVIDASSLNQGLSSDLQQVNSKLESKNKKKKKTKSGNGNNSKTPSEADDRSCRASDCDGDKVKYALSEGSVGSDIMKEITNMTAISAQLV